MIRSRPLSLKLSRIVSPFSTTLLFLIFGLFVRTLNTPAKPAQKKESKKSELRWNPPQVDAALSSISATPPCQIANVLKQAGDRAEELITHLQDLSLIHISTPPVECLSTFAAGKSGQSRTTPE